MPHCAAMSVCTCYVSTHTVVGVPALRYPILEPTGYVKGKSQQWEVFEVRHGTLVGALGAHLFVMFCSQSTSWCCCDHFYTFLALWVPVPTVSVAMPGLACASPTWVPNMVQCLWRWWRYTVIMAVQGAGGVSILLWLAMPARACRAFTLPPCSPRTTARCPCM